MGTFSGHGNMSKSENRRFSEGYHDLGQLKALVVDERETTHTILRSILGSFGFHHVRRAANTEEALTMLREDGADMIVADAAMTPVDGIEFARRIRQSDDIPDPHVPIVLLTEEAKHLQSTEGTGDAGLTKFLARPVSPKALKDHVMSLVESPRALIRTETYVGPDRRQGEMPFDGLDRRTE